MLSLFATGAGHIYVGRCVRGCGWFSAGALAALATGALARSAFRVAGLVGIVLLVAVPVGVYVAAAIDAAKLASKREKRVNIWVVLLAVAALYVGWGVVRNTMRRFFLEAFKIPSAGVAPTLVVGDHIFADKLTPRIRPARRGELIVFPFPEHPDQDFVKRVVALPGDDVKVNDGRLSLNGWLVPRCRVGRWKYHDEVMLHDGDVWVEFLGDSAYVVFEDAGAPFGGDGEWRVAPGQLFVMGDNRRNSHDSRMWYGGSGGGVPISTVRGLALTIWLSAQQDSVDWSRMGSDLTGRRPTAPSGLEADLGRCMRERPTGTVEPPRE